MNNVFRRVHQGSLAATIHGSAVERLSYDPWGRRRNTTNFGYDNVNHTFDRGYTLHEHYDGFDLINMNGRMYDPVVSSFLSVDQYVQSPENAQGFNRYAYCMYNPLRYVDPSGWRAGGGLVGYTPNSFSNANDPYAFVEHGCFLEPRDICGVGIRTEVATAVLRSYMYGNHLSVGGFVSYSDDGKIIDIDVFLSLKFDNNQLNQSLPAGVIGKCVLVGLGSTMKYWKDNKGDNWGDGTKQWLKKAEKYMEQTGNDFSNPKYLIEFIQWNDAENTFKSYEATFIPLSEVPEAISDDYVVAACSELMRKADIQINSGEKGHFANVSRIKTYNGSIELDFIEPEGTYIMKPFTSPSLNYHPIPDYLYNISFIKYRLKP